MKSKYILIDKSIIIEGVTFDFSIFIEPKPNQELECFKEEGHVISNDNMIAVKNIDALYIEDSKLKNYEIYYKTYLFNLEQSEKIRLRFIQRTEEIYANTSNVLENFFKDPTSSNYKESKKTVLDLVSVIVDDSFTMKSIVKIAKNDFHTHTHSINVAIYALSLGLFLKLKKETLLQLGEAGLLHDLGKSKIDSRIVNKNGKFTATEFKVMSDHPLLGYKLGLELGIKNELILDAIRYHHEKIDGSGYPYGISEAKIPLFARIVAICEVFDALTSKRSYKEAMSSFDALKLMKTQMKNHLDPKLLNKMIMMFR